MENTQAMNCVFGCPHLATHTQSTELITSPVSLSGKNKHFQSVEHLAGAIRPHTIIESIDLSQCTIDSVETQINIYTLQHAQAPNRETLRQTFKQLAYASARKNLILMLDNKIEIQYFKDFFKQMTFQSTDECADFIKNYLPHLKQFDGFFKENDRVRIQDEPITADQKRTVLENIMSISKLEEIDITGFRFRNIQDLSSFVQGFHIAPNKLTCTRLIIGEDLTEYPPLPNTPDEQLKQKLWETLQEGLRSIGRNKLHE